VRILVAVLVWAAAIAGGIGVSTVVAHSIHHELATTSADPSNLTSTDKLSLFKTANLAKAMAIAAKDVGPNAQVDSFTLYPGYASIQVVQGNTETDEYVNVNGDHSQSTSPFTDTGDVLFPLSEITSDFASTLAQRIATLGQTPESQLHYMIVETDPDTKKLVWYAYTVPGARAEYFQMNAPNGKLFAEISGVGLKRAKG
jgi:hypothetical protein